MVYWAKRAENYNSLEWAKDGVSMLLSACDIRKDDAILDAGCGTGIMADKLSHFAEVIGLDSCYDMLDKAPNSFQRHLGDITHLPYKEGTFDKAIARMVLHHLVEPSILQLALSELRRVIKSGGVIVIQEGIPPTPELSSEYANIFRLKEHRRTFSETGLINILIAFGFRSINSQIYSLKMSVRNWLDNDGTLSKKAKDKIFNLHRDSSPLFKKEYNLQSRDGDILIDTKVAIVTGVK